MLRYNADYLEQFQKSGNKGKIKVGETAQLNYCWILKTALNPMYTFFKLCQKLGVTNTVYCCDCVTVNTSLFCATYRLVVGIIFPFEHV